MMILTYYGIKQHRIATCNIRRDFVDTDTKHGIAPRPIIDIDIEM